MAAVAKAARRPKQALARVTVADAVTGRLRAMILSGEIPQGAALRQDALAEELGTSRIPVREALSRLEGEGLAASFPHRGYVVAPLSREEIVELYDLRGLLEPELIRLAIPNMTPDKLDAASRVMASFDSAIERKDIQTWGEMNLLYHMALYQPAGRTRTLEIVRGLLVNTHRYTRVLLQDFGPALAQAEEDHHGILELCRKGLVNQAVALTRDHIQRNKEELLETIVESHAWGVT